MDTKAMYRLTYGLVVLTAKDGKDNGCIINTLQQVTTTPNRISICVNKQNLTHDMIDKTRQFNVSILTEKAPFGIYQQFGFQSGKNVDKFADFAEISRTENGIAYLPFFTNAVISARVLQTVDLFTHTLFIADVADCSVLSDEPSVTYAYYQSNVKPKPQPKPEKKGFRCSVCGYVYEGETLPEDFVCPICKHGAIDFEKI